MRDYYVYILTNKWSSTLYTGVTIDLEKRVYQHKNRLIDGFTSRYNVDRLIYYEQCGDIRDVITREKELKGWTHAKKLALINTMNPQWRDLSSEWNT